MRNPLRRLSRPVARLRRLNRRVKNAVVVGLTQGAVWLLGRLSLDDALRLGEWVGARLYVCLPRTRRLMREHLSLVFGRTLSPAARDHLARAAFVNMARCFCELAKIDAIRERRDTYFAVDGWEHAERLLANGTGAVIVTGHIGNWELLAACFAWKGLPVAAFARRLYATRLNDVMIEFRRRQGIETIIRESPHSSRQIVRVLNSNALLAMPIDRDPHALSVSVPFFRRSARTPVGAAALAIRRNLPAAAVFIQRRPDGGHRIAIHPPFDVQRSGDTQADIRALTRQFNAALEAQINNNPAEWVWGHGRWRRPPQPHLDLDGVFQYTLKTPL